MIDEDDLSYAIEAAKEDLRRELDNDSKIEWCADHVIDLLNRVKVLEDENRSLIRQIKDINEYVNE